MQTRVRESGESNEEFVGRIFIELDEVTKNYQKSTEEVNALLDQTVVDLEIIRATQTNSELLNWHLENLPEKEEIVNALHKNEILRQRVQNLVNTFDQLEIGNGLLSFLISNKDFTYKRGETDEHSQE